MLRKILLATGLLGLAPAPALAAPDRVISLQAGETTSFKGTTATGANVNYFNISEGVLQPVAPAGTCSKDVQTYCDRTLVALSNPVPEDDADGRLVRRVTVTLGDYGPVPDPATDFDLLAFASDADGTRGAELARDGNLTDTAAETVTFSLVTTRERPVAYALVDVVYFASVGSGYGATVKG